VRSAGENATTRHSRDQTEPPRSGLVHLKVDSLIYGCGWHFVRPNPAAAFAAPSNRLLASGFQMGRPGGRNWDCTACGLMPVPGLAHPSGSLARSAGTACCSRSAGPPPPPPWDRFSEAAVNRCLAWGAVTRESPGSPLALPVSTPASGVGRAGTRLTDGRQAARRHECPRPDPASGSPHRARSGGSSSPPPQNNNRYGPLRRTGGIAASLLLRTGSAHASRRRGWRLVLLAGPKVRTCARSRCEFHRTEDRRGPTGPRGNRWTPAFAGVTEVGSG